MRRTNQRSTLFLVELITSVTLFTVCAAVCTALLVHARSLSRESDRLTQAVYLAQSAAEEWRATGSVPGGETADTELTCAAQETGGTLTVAVYDGDELVYQLKEVARLG